MAMHCTASIIIVPMALQEARLKFQVCGRGKSGILSPRNNTMAHLPEVREAVFNDVKTALESNHQLSSTDASNRQKLSTNKSHSSYHPSHHGAKPRARKASMMGAIVGGVNFGFGGAIAGAAIGHTVDRAAEAHRQRKVDNTDTRPRTTASNGECDAQQRTCVIV